MSSKGQLLQDPFLNTLRKEHVPMGITHDAFLIGALYNRIFCPFMRAFRTHIQTSVFVSVFRTAFGTFRQTAHAAPCF